ncbi:hypothetical protein ABH920_001910 [Catenulispora sp. EB89]|nr:hypothetical protein [Catenulispora rubra]
MTTVTKARKAALFIGPDRLRVQSLAESHEYKKKSGSSDTAHTYDTTAL